MSSNSDAAAATVHAHGRLAMLAAHLLPSQLTHHGALHPLHLSSQLPPPPNLAGTLTVVDERTGKKYQLHVSKEGTVKASDLKKVNFLLIHEIFNFDLCFLRNTGSPPILLLSSLLNCLQNGFFFPIPSCMVKS